MKENMALSLATMKKITGNSRQKSKKSRSYRMQQTVASDCL
jgi:hypothetical protein